MTKALFVAVRECERCAWFLRHEAGSQALTVADRFRVDEGIEVGRLARGLHPDGTLVGELNVASAAARTRELLADTSVATLYEATFQVDDYAAKADVLRRRPGGWALIEVKASLRDKPEYVDDLAYTAMVMQVAGVPVVSAELALLSREYRRGMDVQRLFAFEDHTEGVLERAAEFLSVRERVAAVTGAESPPPVTPSTACRSCEYFDENCVGVGAENHVLGLPRLSGGKLAALLADGIDTIDDIPDEFDLTAMQARVRACVATGEPFVSPTLRDALDQVQWPAAYLDFETVTTALPLYPGLAPYTQVPFQYSLHVRAAPGQVPEHRGYLADPRRDGRRELAERLLRDLAGTGSIVVYTSFEQTILRGLAEAFADLKDDLDAILARLYDLHAVIRDGYYHPDFHGSLSIKQVLPVLVPDMTYDGLGISDGLTASAQFARMAKGLCDDDEARALRTDLETYCHQDTLAMVGLHDKLLELAR